MAAVSDGFLKDARPLAKAVDRAQIMRMKQQAAVRRKATNLYLPENDVAQAKVLGVNISRACEAGLRQAVQAAAARRWEDENRFAMEGWARWIEKNGSPLDKYRAF